MNILIIFCCYFIPVENRFGHIFRVLFDIATDKLQTVINYTTNNFPNENSLDQSAVKLNQPIVSKAISLLQRIKRMFSSDE
ncbi:hypothetical protein NUSPORA_02303 [Nucleospora cyclopteri]